MLLRFCIQVPDLTGDGPSEEATAGEQAAAGLAKLKGVFKSFNGRVEVRPRSTVSFLFSSLGFLTPLVCRKAKIPFQDGTITTWSIRNSPGRLGVGEVSELH